MGRLPSQLAILLSMFLAARANAWPVDQVRAVEVGKVSMNPLSSVDWVEVEDPKIADAEILPGGELMLSGKAPGRTWVLLYAEGRMAVWSVRVSTPAKTANDLEPVVATTKRACPGMRIGEDEKGPTLTATVADAKCRTALLELCKTDLLIARQLDLTFTLAALQGQLSDIESGIRGATREKVNVHYSGAGLVIDGTLSASDHRKVLWQLFQRSAGRPSLEDRIEVTGPGNDGGNSHGPQ